MKTTKLLSGVVSILIFLAFTLGYAEEKKAYVPKDDEEIYGTWANTDYGVGFRGVKLVISPDGKFTEYGTETSTRPTLSGTFNITKKWTDSNGENIWYKATFDAEQVQTIYYHIIRISESGTVMEYEYSSIDYPTKIDPNDLESQNYTIRYRQ
jgi:hypothetical protein